MLAQLSVQNFAVIKNIAIEFDEGLNALTGETGAGKSVLIDALALALGYKASREAVRTGCEKTVVQAAFLLTKTIRPACWRKKQVSAWKSSSSSQEKSPPQGAVFAA